MSFLKKHGYDVVRLFLTQFGIAVFSILVSMVLNSDWIQASQYYRMYLVLGIFCMCFYMFIIYTTIWEYGARDSVRVEAGRVEYDPHFGFKLGFFASLPNLLLAFLMLVGFLFGCGALGMHYDWAAGLFLTVRLFQYFLEAMYNGIIEFFVHLNIVSAATQAGNPLPAYIIRTVAAFVITLPLMGTCALAYRMGYKNVRVFATLFRKNTKK